ncbi:hypothetical protein OF829_09970 [Sphingomonas sp. LB-2]|uniref:hypothetical protein n=1 Tax=Sphingomonas caeni TaxID=2984949 RepID=UPI00222E30C9|nr:hypothetical protein [Sphingomonas caeni]MCW3847569.1 hypothetical protein [Sphingomonas caeni]
MPPLTDQQKIFYENTLSVTKEEIADLDDQIAQETATSQARLADLQSAKASSLQMYAAACERLQIPNDLAPDAASG